MARLGVYFLLPKAQQSRGHLNRGDVDLSSPEVKEAINAAVEAATGPLLAFDVLHGGLMFYGVG